MTDLVGANIWVALSVFSSIKEIPVSAATKTKALRDSFLAGAPAIHEANAVESGRETLITFRSNRSTVSDSFGVKVEHGV